jgi:hypothetical protein
MKRDVTPTKIYGVQGDPFNITVMKMISQSILQFHKRREHHEATARFVSTINLDNCQINNRQRFFVFNKGQYRGSPTIENLE